MLIAQISDPHVTAGRRRLHGVVDTASMLAACAGDLMRLDPRPDLLVATGDLVDRGRPAEYARLRELLAPLTMPVFLAAGNHDDRDALRTAFGGPGHEYLRSCGDFLQYTVEFDDLRLLVLDTVVPGEDRGALCDARLDWIEARLDERRVPTIVAMHHPPFVTGIAHMDRAGLEGADQFEAIVARHPHVERIVCGHLHRPIECRFGRTFASTCPSPAHQVALDLRDDGPDRFVMEPPGYQLHLWREGCLITHTRVLGDYAGPYPLRDAGG